MNKVPLISAIITLTTASTPYAENIPASDVPQSRSLYSPYAESSIPRRVYFDTHLHTTYSADAGLVGAILTPEDAYRLARAEQINSNFGLPAKLTQPHDFLAVTDHSENLGLSPILKDASPENLEISWAKQVATLLNTRAQQSCTRV